MKIYDAVRLGYVKPIDAVKRLVYRVIGGKIVQRDKVITLIDKAAKKYSTQPKRTALAIYGFNLGDWVGYRFNHHKALIQYVGVHSTLNDDLTPLNIAKQCDKCGESTLNNIMFIPKQGGRRILQRKKIAVDVVYCDDCQQEVEEQMEEVLKNQYIIDKAKRETRK